MKVLITGVYGIVGSYLCEKLKKDHEVIGIGRKKEYSLCNKYYQCDITDRAQMKKIFMENRDIDIIIHCAALAHNKGNDLSKEKFTNVNFKATKYLVELSNEIMNLKNLIFISTISVYGERLDKNTYTEEDECYPKSPYAVAKRKSEEFIKNKYNSNYTILRLAPVYSDKFKLNIERRSLIKGVPYKVGNGEQKLSLCNIKNIYIAIDYIINNYETEKSEIYNISDNKVCQFNDLLNFIGAKKKVIIPKFSIKILNGINQITVKNQFIHENSIKLISDNIYDSSKINKKIKMKYDIEDN